MGCDGGKTANGSGAMVQCQIKVPTRDSCCIVWIGQAHFLGEGIGVEPVDQSFAPTGDDGCLRIVRVGIDETWAKQRIAIIVNCRLGMRGSQRRGCADGSDLARLDEHPAGAVDPHGVFP